MNGENPNTQNNEFTGGVLGAAPTPQVVPTPVEPVAPTPQVAPTPVEPVAPIPQVVPTSVESVAPTPQVAPTPVEPVAPTPQVAPTSAEPVVPTPQVAPTSAEPVAPTPVGPTAQPIPGTEGLLATPNKGANMMANQGANFMNQQKPVDIGTVPPELPKQEKKKTNKILFIVLIVVLIAGVAFGVYYFLTKSKKKLEITPKNVQLLIKNDIPTNISFYASVANGDASECTVDITGVDNVRIGDYDVKIICGDNTYTSKLSVVDTIPPVVLTNILFKKVSSPVDVNEFIYSYIENSEDECTSCSSKFVDESNVSSQIQNPGGPYEVEIESSDGNGNKTNTKAIMYITESDIIAYMKCTSSREEITVNDIHMNKELEDIFAIGSVEGAGFAFLNAGRRLYRYQFNSVEDYQNAIGDKSDEISFNEITGHAGYDDANRLLTISVDLSKETLDSENGGSFPQGFSEIKTIYETTKGYSCANTAYLDTIIK